jgi:hypothetical protein
MPMTQEDLSRFVAEMEDRLEWLIAEDDPSGNNLTLSPGSLGHVENLVLERFSSSKDALADNNANDLDLFMRYVGEVFVRQIPGMRWAVETQDRENAYFGIPVVRCGSGEHCPLFLVTAAADRRTGKHIRRVFDHALELSSSAAV